MKPYRALFLREISIGLRAGGGLYLSVLFFLAVISLYPFAIGADLERLALFGPAILWTGALLSTLLSLDRLLQADHESGALDLIRISGRSPTALMVTKCAAHWVTTGLPLALATPLFALFLNMEPTAILGVTASILVGTPALSFIGITGAAVTVTLPRGGLLLSILILPLSIPVLIFGAATALAATDPILSFWSPFAILCALSLFMAVVGPTAAGYFLSEE